MRRPVTAAALLAALTLTTACGSNDSAGEPATPAPSSEQSPDDVDCTDTTLTDAAWMEHCADSASDGDGTGGDGGGIPVDLEFGEVYEWPDGLAVTVAKAAVFTDFTAEEGAPSETETEFRISLELTNGGEDSADLGELSTFVEGATSGGEAAATEFETGSAPLDGRLAPGVTAVKTDDNALEKEHGTDIVVTVRRIGDGGMDEWVSPEFVGTIAP